MKRSVWNRIWAAILGAGIFAAGCPWNALAEEPEEIIVFAAASLTETLDELIEKYKEMAPEVSVVATYDSSGTLKTQIEEGADCDLFLSAGMKQMDQLDIEAGPEKNPDGLDLVLSESRVSLLENKVTLVVPEGNPAGIRDFENLAERLAQGEVMLAMGNSDVPVGQYTQKILDYFGLDEKELASAGVLTYGSNVKEVTTQVAEGLVDCGIVYGTDAFSAELDVMDEATEEMCGRVICPAAVIKNRKHQEEAERFLEYLQTDEAMEIFEAVGFADVE